MALQTYLHEPFFSFEDVNRLFDEAYGVLDFPTERRSSRRRGNGQVERLGSFAPKVDVHESAENNLVTASFELPGLKKEDVTIDLQNNRLVVSGETNFSEQKEENGYVVKERRSGKFSRAVPVPQGTKPEDIKASMEHGVLTVTYPKSSPEQQAKRITIV